MINSGVVNDFLMWARTPPRNDLRSLDASVDTCGNEVKRIVVVSIWRRDESLSFCFRF